MADEFLVRGCFPDTAQAQHAARLLMQSGLRRDEVDVPGRRPQRPGSHEAPFLWRVLVIILAWSVAGTIVGATLGFLLAYAGIGPGGSAGLIIQTVSFAVFGHLIAGLWAGYGVLADRSEREMAPDREEAWIAVSCRGEGEAGRLAAALRAAGASDVEVAAPEPSRSTAP